MLKLDCSDVLFWECKICDIIVTMAADDLESLHRQVISNNGGNIPGMEPVASHIFTKSVDGIPCQKKPGAVSASG